MGIVRFALKFPHTFYVLAALMRFSRRHRDLQHAGRYLPGDQHSCRVSHLAVHRPQHAGDGTARHHLRPIFDQLERHGYQEYGGADAERSFGAEDLLPAGRQSRPRDRADRRGDQLHSRVDAGGHRAPVGRAIQRLERSGAAAQPELEHSERAAALRLRHLSGAPGACSSPWRHAADARRRQIPPDHGRHRSPQARSCGA